MFKVTPNPPDTDSIDLLQKSANSGHCVKAIGQCIHVNFLRSIDLVQLGKLPLAREHIL